MPISPTIDVQVLANQLFTAGVSSGAQLTIRAPYSCSNMQVNSLSVNTPWGTTGAPALIWEIGSDGTILSGPNQSLSQSNVSYSGGSLQVTVTLPTLTQNTTAVVINTTFKVGVSKVNSQQSGTFTPTHSICWSDQYDPSFDVVFDAEVMSLNPGTPTVVNCTGYPSSYGAGATAKPATVQPVSNKREVKVTVPITITSPPTNPAILMVPFSLALNFA